MQTTKNINSRVALKALAFLTLVAFVCTDMLIFPFSSFASTGSTVLPSGQKAQDLSAASVVWNEQLPSEWGKIEEISRVPRATDNVPRNENHGPWPVSQKFVVFIQDAHDSLEAQENIAKMITHLVRNYGVRTVFEEGYEGKVPTDEFFGFIKDPALKGKTAAFFMDKLRVGGAEYAHINRDMGQGPRTTNKTSATGRGPQTTKDTRGPWSVARVPEWQLIGADSFELHQKGIRDYRESEKSRQTIEKDLSALDQELKSVIFAKLSKEFKQWLKLKERFSQGQLPLLDYLKRTLEIRRTSLQRQESRRVYPNMERVLSGDDSRIKDVDLSGLFREIEGLEDEIVFLWLKTEEERQAFYFYQNVLLLEKLSAVKVSDAEFDALKARFSGLTTQKIGEMISSVVAKPLVLSKRWELQIRSALDFYETARLRDSSIAKALDQYFLKGRNAQRTTYNAKTDRSNVERFALSEKVPGSEPVILVYGGFHKENIKRILKEKGIGYVIVTPRISAPSPRHEAFYKRLMDVGYHNFEATLALRTGSRVKPLVAMGELGRAEVRKVAADLASGMTPEMIERSFPVRRRIPVALKTPRSEARERLNMTIRYSDSFYRDMNALHASVREKLLKKIYEELSQKAMTVKYPADFGVGLKALSKDYSELKLGKLRIFFQFEMFPAYPKEDKRNRQIFFNLYWKKSNSSGKQHLLDAALEAPAVRNPLDPNIPQDADKIDELNKWLYNESEENEEIQVESRPSGLVLGGLQHVDSLHGFVGLFMGDITQGGSPVVLPIREMRQALALAHHDPKAAARIWVGEELADAEKFFQLWIELEERFLRLIAASLKLPQPEFELISFFYEEVASAVLRQQILEKVEDWARRQNATREDIDRIKAVYLKLQEIKSLNEGEVFKSPVIEAVIEQKETALRSASTAPQLVSMPVPVVKVLPATAASSNGIIAPIRTEKAVFKLPDTPELWRGIGRVKVLLQKYGVPEGLITDANAESVLTTALDPKLSKNKKAEELLKFFRGSIKKDKIGTFFSGLIAIGYPLAASAVDPETALSYVKDMMKRAAQAYSQGDLEDADRWAEAAAFDRDLSDAKGSVASELAEIHAEAVNLGKEIDEMGELLALLFKPTGEPLFLPELELFRIAGMLDHFSEDQITVLRRILLLSPLLERLEEMQHYEVFVAAYFFPFSEVEQSDSGKMALRIKSTSFLRSHVSPNEFSKGIAKIIEVRREMLEAKREPTLRPEMRVLQEGDLFSEKDVLNPKNGEPTMTYWMDATIPKNVYFAIDGVTLGEIGAGDRLWEELLAIKGIYGKTLKILVTGKIGGKAEKRIRELEAFGGQVFTEAGAIRIPETSKVIYFTNDENPADLGALPGRMGRNVKAVFRKLQKADFLTAVQLSLSSLLEEDLLRQINLRSYVAERLGFDATRELGVLFDAYVAITRAA